MLFINTRPADRAQQLTSALQAEGLTVLELPLLALDAMPWSESLATLFAQINEVQVIRALSTLAFYSGDCCGESSSGGIWHAGLGSSWWQA